MYYDRGIEIAAHNLRQKVTGWNYIELDEPEYRRVSHYAVLLADDEIIRVIQLDFASLHQMPGETFDRLVAMDFPKRSGLGPLTVEEVDSLWAQYQLGEAA